MEYLFAFPPRATAMAGAYRQAECSQDAQIILYLALGERIIQL